MGPTVRRRLPREDQHLRLAASVNHPTARHDRPDQLGRRDARPRPLHLHLRNRIARALKLDARRTRPQRPTRHPLELLHPHRLDAGRRQRLAPIARRRRPGVLGDRARRWPRDQGHLAATNDGTGDLLLARHHPDRPIRPSSTPSTPPAATAPEPTPTTRSRTQNKPPPGRCCSHTTSTATTHSPQSPPPSTTHDSSASHSHNSERSEIHPWRLFRTIGHTPARPSKQ